jgi:hypothetical protein
MSWLGDLYVSCMNGHFLRWVAGVGVALAIAGSIAACGSPSQSSGGTHGAGGATGSGGLGGSGGSVTSFVGAGGANEQGLQVTPSALQTLDVAIGGMTPTVTYAATLNGEPVKVAWSVDQGSIGNIPAGPSTSATFAPSGTTGGMVNVLAVLNGKTVTRPIMVKLSGSQNGPNTSPGETAQTVPNTPAGVAQLSAGGGVGGVGGEGLGPAVPAGATLTALGMPTGSAAAQNLTTRRCAPSACWRRC